jgi:hypothetical protein
MSTEQHAESSVRSLHGRAIGTALVGLAALAASGSPVFADKPRTTGWNIKTSKKVFDVPAERLSATGGVNVAAGDIDGDGRADLLVSGSSPSGNTLDVLGFDSVSLNFTKITYNYPENDKGAKRIAVGDVTGDGVPDLILGDGAGSTSAIRAAGGPVKIKIDIDWAAQGVNAFGEKVNAGVSIAAGRFRPSTTGAPNPLGDIIVGTSGALAGPPGTPTPSSKIRRISMASSLGASGDLTSYMKVAEEYAVYGSSYTGGIRVASGDVDGDGVADIVTVPQTGLDRTVSFIKIDFDATGTASFIKFDSFTIAAASADAPISIAVGDVDGDGRADVVLGEGTSSVTVGGVTLTPRVRIASAPPAGAGLEANWAEVPSLGLSAADLGYGPNYIGGVEVALGDFTGDGVLDLLTANAAPVPEPATLATLAGGCAALLSRRRRRV